jgi:hypothetical protein
LRGHVIRITERPLVNHSAQLSHPVDAEAQP